MQYKFTEQAKEIFKNNLKQGGEGIGFYNKYPGLDFTPKRATSGSSGYDLSACIPRPVTLLANEEVKIGTGVHIWIGSEIDYEVNMAEDLTMCGLLLPRSSIKGCQLTNTAGIIDADYQGEVIASLWNRTDTPITINPGQKLVQLIYIFAALPEMELVEEFHKETDRGEGGFGHTDCKQ
jgi:dUTP pyrophosphatase